MATKIMLVDDSPICNLIMQKVLTRLPLDVDISDFTNPLTAFGQVAELNPTVIFLDLNMPELDGWGFLQQMKETNLTHPVIILTSSTSALDQARCVEFPNVLAYHTKPLTKEVVGALLLTLQTDLAQ